MNDQTQQNCDFTPRPPTPCTQDIHLHAVVEGSESFEKGTWPEKVINGGFTIQAISDCSKLTGDGYDEYTWWEFDFTQCGDWKRMFAVKRLTSALFMLRLDPHDMEKTDAVRWLSSDDTFGGDSIPLRDLGHTGTVTVTIELLDHWSPEEIIEALMSGRRGVFAMEYGDDALIRRAELTIEALAYVRT